MTQLVALSLPALPALIATADASAQQRFFEFFTANIRNRNTRRAYGLAVREFLLWCDHHRVRSIAAVAPVHVAGYIEQLNRPDQRGRGWAQHWLVVKLLPEILRATRQTKKLRGPTM